MIVITLISCWLKHGLNVKKKLKSEIAEIVANDENCREKEKSIDNHQIINAFYYVGMTGFEPATSRPPDDYYISHYNLDYQCNAYLPFSLG